MAAFDALVHLLHRCLVVLTAVGAAPEHETLGREGGQSLVRKERLWYYQGLEAMLQPVSSSPPFASLSL